MILLVVACFFRFRGIEDQLLAGDEYHALRAAMKFDVLTLFTYYGVAENSIPMSMFARLLMVTVGLTELTFRIPVILSGLVILLSPFYFRKSLGTGACLLATSLLALSPMAIYFTFVGRPYGPAAALLIVALLGWKRWIASHRKRDLLLFTVPAAFAVFFHLLCLMPVGWLVLMSWVAAKRKEIEYRSVAKMTGLLLLLGLALLGPGVPGLLEHRLIGSHRPGVGNPQLAWIAFVRLCGEHLGTSIAFLLLMALGARRLIQREGSFGITLSGLFPMLLLGMFITQPWPTDHAWARYEFLALSPFFMLVAVGAGVLLEGLHATLRGRKWLAAGLLLVSLAPLAVRLDGVVGAETTAQTWLPWVLGALLFAVALGAVLAPKVSAEESATHPASAVAFPCLALLWGAGAIAWTPVPIIQQEIDSLRTARRSVALVTDEMNEKSARRVPQFFKDIAGEPDAGEVLLMWPFVVDTSTWRGFRAFQKVHGKRVVLMQRGNLKKHEASGITFRNVTDRRALKDWSTRGARYLVLNLSLVAPPKKAKGEKRPKSPFTVKDPPATHDAYLQLKTLLKDKFGKASYVDEHIEVFDLLAAPPGAAGPAQD